MHSYTYSTNTYCITAYLSGFSTAMPMASKEKNIPEKVDRGKKTLELENIYFYLKTKKLKVS